MVECTRTIEDLVIDLTIEVVAAYVACNRVPVSDLPLLIGDMHAAFVRLVGESAEPAPHRNVVTPAQITGSITPEALISFEDGRSYKTLKRHLTRAGLDPETYRRKWGLPRDYPMTAPNYSARRSALAKSFGLGLPHADRVQRISRREGLKVS